MSKTQNLTPTTGTVTTTPDNRPVWKMLTIEPVIILHMVSALLGLMAIQDLLFAKACRIDFGYDEKVCAALESKQSKESYMQEELEIQKFMGPLIMWRMMLMNLLPVLLVFLVGAWSDKFGRKLPIILVQSSFVAYHLFLVLCTVLPIGVWTMGLLSSFIISLGGSQAVFGMAVFSYVADTTPKDKVSQRTPITGMCFFFGVTVGLALRGYLASQGLTFAQLFSVGAAMEGAALLYLIVMIRNVRDEKAIKGISTGEMIKDIFNLKHISDSLASVFKKREANNRKKLICLLMCHFLVMMPMMGENNVVYLFTRYQFNWDASAFAGYMTYKMVISFVGNFVSMGLWTGLLKLSDPKIGIVSCVAQLLTSVICVFATSPTALYAGPIIALFAGSIATVARTVIFKIVPSTETGKVNALLGSLEGMTQLVGAPMYTMLYTATFERFAGAFFILSASCMIPPMLVYVWLLKVDDAKKGKKE